MNDRLPYADVSIATVLVVAGLALAAYPWLGGVPVVLGAITAALAVVAMFVVRRPQGGIVSGQILDVTSRAAR